MGEGLGGPLSSYLDTQAAIWLAQTNLARISKVALRHIEASSLLISPMALLEIQYLFDIKRINLPARDIETKLTHEIGVRVCNLDFYAIAAAAMHETWTRDPFDRIIVAHARINALSPLVTSDEKIGRSYPRSIW